MLAGPGGVGKTMFELQVALAIACGGSICGGMFDGVKTGALMSNRPGKVVLVTAEESVDVIWHRLHAIVATLLGQSSLMGVDVGPADLLDLWAENLHIYPLAGLPRITFMDGDLTSTEHFKQLVNVCAGARLVILDPVRRFHSCDENDSGAMTSLVQLLQGLSARTKAAVIFSHHTNRASTQLGMGDTAGAARGSTALTDGVRWQMNFSKVSKEVTKRRGISEDEVGRFVMVDIAKSNNLPPQPTLTLERHVGGVLLVAERQGAPSAQVSFKANTAKVKRSSKGVLV
jgi:RecA-family ATPase